MASLKDLIVNGSTNLIGESFADIIHANSFKTNGGTSNDFVKGDGSLDPNVYITSAALSGLALDADVVHKSNPDNTVEVITASKTVMPDSNSSASFTIESSAATPNAELVLKSYSTNKTPGIRFNRSTLDWVIEHDADLMFNSKTSSTTKSILILRDRDGYHNAQFGSGISVVITGDAATPTNELVLKNYPDGNKTPSLRFQRSNAGISDSYIDWLLYANSDGALYLVSERNESSSGTKVTFGSTILASYLNILASGKSITTAADSSTPTNTISLVNAYTSGDSTTYGYATPKLLFQRGPIDSTGNIYNNWSIQNTSGGALNIALETAINSATPTETNILTLSGSYNSNTRLAQFGTGVNVKAPTFEATTASTTNSTGYIKSDGSGYGGVFTNGSSPKPGLVPAGPASNQTSLYLRGDGTWHEPPGGGGTATSISYDNDTIQFDPDTVVVPSTETSTKTINVVSANDVQNVSGTLEGKITNIKAHDVSKPWNQLVSNGNFSRWLTVSISTTPDDFSRNSYAGTSFMDASRINAGDTDGIKMSFKASTGISTGYLYCYAPYIDANHKYYVSLWRRSDKTVRFYVLKSTTDVGSIDFAADTTGSFVSGVVTANSSATSSNARFGIGVYSARSGNYAEIRYLNVVDLTRIYGEGNEPTAADFEAEYGTEWRTMCEFCSPSVVGYKEPGITFTGYNLLVNGNKTVLPAATYKIEGDYTSVLFSALNDGDTGYTALSPSGGVFTLANAGYVLVEGYNASTTCIHKSTGTTSYAAPTKSTIVINPSGICGTCDGETEVVFPNGLMKIGTTCDEIITDPDGIARTATKRINVRAFAEGDATSETMITDGVNTAEIITAKTYQLVGPIDMRFMTDSSGIDVVSTALDGEQMGMRRNVDVSISYTEHEDIEPVRNTQYETDKRHIQDWRIDGVDITPLDNSTNIVTSGGVKNYVDRRCRMFYGECYTETSFSRKNVVCPEMKREDLVPGTILILKVWYKNTAAVANLVLNVNDFGSYPIKKIYGTSGTVNLTHSYELAGTCMLYFTGTNWILVTTDFNSTYANYSFGNGYATDSRTDDTSPTAVTALYSSSGSTKYYILSNNGIVAVRFKHDVGASATLNIDGKGAKEILYNGAPITAGVIKAGDTVTFIYTTVTNITGHSAGYVVLSIDRACYEADTIYENYLKAGDTIGTVTLTEFNPVADTVHITPQSLGTSQQTQARANISAQETLVSGTNIKTINNQSILGSGNLDISGGGGSSVTVDTALSTTSTNPVENRVITNALSGKVSDVTVGGTSVVSNGTAVIPAIPGDTKVTQTVSSATANWRGVLIGSSNNASESGSLNTTTDTCMVYEGLRYQPSTGTLKATKFKGTLQGTVEGAVTVYSGSGTPSSSLGSDGDIYIKTS